MTFRLEIDLTLSTLLAIHENTGGGADAPALDQARDETFEAVLSAIGKLPYDVLINAALKDHTSTALSTERERSPSPPSPETSSPPLKKALHGVLTPINEDTLPKIIQEYTDKLQASSKRFEVFVITLTDTTYAIKVCEETTAAELTAEM